MASTTLFTTGRPPGNKSNFEGVHPGSVIHVSKALTYLQLLRVVWRSGSENDTHYRRVYMGQLRRKPEADPSRPRHIAPEPGVGCRLL